MGYEFNMGAEWGVTRHLNLALQGALWQPGAWFREAHQGRGVTLAAQGASPSPVETRPPIYGLSASVTMEF